MTKDLTGLNSLRQALTPYDDVKFELNLNRHPKAHKNKSIVYAENMKLSKDGAVLENEESIEINATIDNSLKDAYKNGYTIIHVIPCNTELVLFVKENNKNTFDIWRYREKTNKYSEKIARFYKAGIVYNGGKFSGTFTYTSNDSLIIAFCEYDSEDNTIMNPMMTINLGTFTKGYIPPNNVGPKRHDWISSLGEFTDRTLEPYKLPICPEVSLPQITNVSNIKGNSYIGTYYVYIRYKINKYDYTQWFNIGYPIINEYKQDMIIHQKVTKNEKNKSDNNIEDLIPTNKTNRDCKLNTYVNQNVDLINNCLNINIQHNNILYDNCQIGFICISNTYTKYYISSDIKLINNILISTNVDNLIEEVFNTSLYENYYNVKNIINKNNKVYISNYITTSSKDINVDNINIELSSGQIIKNSNINIKEQIKTIDINGIKLSTNILDVLYKNVRIPKTLTVGQNITTKSINLAYYLKVIGKDSWVTDNLVYISHDPNFEDTPIRYVSLEVCNIDVSLITIDAEVWKDRTEKTFKYIRVYHKDSMTGFELGNLPTTIFDSGTNKYKGDYEIKPLYIKFGENGTTYNLNDYTETPSDILTLTNEVYPELYFKSKIYYNNTLDNFINNNDITGLCQGEVYDFYIHFIDKYGNITNGHKLKNDKNILEAYFTDENNNEVREEVCMYKSTYRIIMPSKIKPFYLDDNNDIQLDLKENYFKSLTKTYIILSNEKDNTIVNSYISNTTTLFTTNIVEIIRNVLEDLKYLNKDFLLNLTFGDIFDQCFYSAKIDEDVSTENNQIYTFDKYHFLKYYNSQGEEFFKVPKLSSTEGDIQLGLKVEIGNITDYGDYVSYFISHKKLEKTYVLNGFGTKHQLDNILLNNKFESGNIVKLYDIKFEEDWDSNLYDKCTIQENKIFKNGFTCYTNLLNKIAYAQDAQNNRTDRQTTLYLSDNNIEYTGYPIEVNEEEGKYGVKYLELLNLNNNKYINAKKLYRLGNIEYTNTIVNEGLNGRYDKHLAVKYGNENDGVNNILSTTGLGSYGDVFLYEIYGFYDFDNLGIYVSEKAKSHIIQNNGTVIGTDIFYEVITTLNLFNYKISNIYDTWINFYNVFNKDDDFLKEFNRTIYRSAVISDEGRTNNWRYFENDAYKNIEENKGNITNLLAIGNYLYVHTEHSLFAFSEDNTLSMNNQNLQVATPDIFDTEYKEVFITKLGYGGLQDKDAWIAGQFGYIWFDGDSKKIYKVYGNSMDIITNDIQEWLENCNIVNVRFANDIRNNRILINIKLQMIYHDILEVRDIVLSYNILSKTFISFHNYNFTNSYNTKNELYFLNNNLDIHKFIEDSYGKNLNIEKQYKLYFIVNPYYNVIKYLEYIKYNLRKRNIKKGINMLYYVETNDFKNFPVEQHLMPYAGKNIRVYNDLVDTDWIDCTNINSNGGQYPDNNIDKFNKPYWDLGNWYFNYLRNVNDTNNPPESRLFGNYFVIAFDFGYVDTLIEFENLDVQLTKDKEL